MEKSKLKKAKTIKNTILPTIDRMVSKHFSQITYPAPYTQSWNADQIPVLAKNNSGRKSNFFNNTKRQPETRRQTQSIATVRGPDPTVPHLKYGVFPKRRTSSSRALNNPVLGKPPRPLTRITHPWPTPSDLASNKGFSNTYRKKPLKKLPLSESPIFVFRTVDRRFSRELSHSEVMHFDIKPKRRTFLSSAYCPAPHFNIMTPKLNVTPICR